MGSLASLRDVPILLIYAVVVIVITSGACLTIGRLIAIQSRALARFSCSLVVPVIGIVGMFLILTVSPVGPPPNDGPAMAAYAVLMLSVFSLPISILTSFAVFAALRSSEAKGPSASVPE